MAQREISGAEADWQRDMAASLRREADDLRKRNKVLEAKIADASDAAIAASGGLSRMSTTAASSMVGQSMIGTSAAPPEDRWANDRRDLQARVAELEERHRFLEMERVRQLANLDRGADVPSSSSTAPAVGTVSASSMVREVDSLSDRLWSEEAATARAEKHAAETEEQLAGAKSEIEAWCFLERPEGRRQSAEARSLHERVAATRAECESRQKAVRRLGEDVARVERAISTLHGDKRILQGSREALMLEATSMRERLESLSRARLHTNTELATLREDHETAVRRLLFEAGELRAHTARSTTRLADTRSRQQALEQDESAARRERSESQKTFRKLRIAHDELCARWPPEAEARRNRRSELREQCTVDGAAGDELGKQLRVSMDDLRVLRDTYSERFQRLQEAAASVASERSRAAEARHQLQGITDEMSAHAEELVHQLEKERTYGLKLWKQVKAASEAARQTRDQALASRPRRRGRENRDPAPNAAARVRSLSTGSRSGRTGQARAAPRKRLSR